MMTVYLIMNEKGEYYGPGGWVEDAWQARMFSPEDAANMLKVFPRGSAIAAHLREEARAA